jgi:hypothetical protein
MRSHPSSARAADPACRLCAREQLFRPKKQFNVRRARACSIMIETESGSHLASSLTRFLQADRRPLRSKKL